MGEIRLIPYPFLISTLEACGVMVVIGLVMFHFYCYYAGIMNILLFLGLEKKEEWDEVGLPEILSYIRRHWIAR